MTAEEFLQSKDIWNHPMVTDRTDSNGYEVEHLLEEYAKIYGKALLEKAAENVRVNLDLNEGTVQVDKDSILKTTLTEK